jgi:hypothetical protein
MSAPNIHVVVTMKTAIVPDQVVDVFNNKIHEKARGCGYRCVSIFKNNANTNMTTGRSMSFKDECETVFGNALRSHTPIIIIINGNNGNTSERMVWMQALRSKVSYTSCASITFCVMNPTGDDAQHAINQRAMVSASKSRRPHHAIHEDMTTQQDNFTFVRQEELPYSYPLVKRINMNVVRHAGSVGIITVNSMHHLYDEIAIDTGSQCLSSSHTNPRRNPSSFAWPFEHEHNPRRVQPWKDSKQIEREREIPVSWDM